MIQVGSEIIAQRRNRSCVPFPCAIHHYSLYLVTMTDFPALVVEVPRDLQSLARADHDVILERQADTSVGERIPYLLDAPQILPHLLFVYPERVCDCDLCSERRQWPVITV